MEVDVDLDLDKEGCVGSLVALKCRRGFPGIVEAVMQSSRQQCWWSSSDLHGDEEGWLMKRKKVGDCLVSKHSIPNGYCSFFDKLCGD